MKKLQVGNILCGVVLAVQLVMEALTAAAIWRLNMLPDKYFAAVIAVLAVLWLIVGLLLFLPGRKRKTGAFLKRKRCRIGLFRRIIGCILAVAIIVCCGFARNVVSDVHSTVDGITGAAEVVNVSMSVYVLDEDPAGTIVDAAGYTFAFLDQYETARTEKFISQINREAGTEVTAQGVAILTDLVEGLYQGETNAIILNSAYITLLEETEEYADFSQRTRILYNAVLEEVIEPQPGEETEQTEESATGDAAEQEEQAGITNSPFVIYISGSDTRDYYLTTSRSDVNILMVVNPLTKQVLLVNTPRDYYVSNPAGNGAKDKLTHCGIYGIPCSIGALEGLYDVSVNYYAQINFTGVETLVDAIGGVDVYSDVAFTAVWTYPISQGWNHLSGPEALGYARDRYSFASGDNARGRHQMQVITAVIEKVTSGTTIISNYSGILDSIQGMFKTNITAEEISQLVKMQLEDLASWNVLSYAVTGAGGSDITYSMPGLYCYVMYPDQKLVDYGSELIDRVLAGEILTEADMTCPN